MVTMFPKGKGRKLRYIDVNLPNGKCPRVSLGRLNESPALRIEGMVRRLETCARTGEPHDESTARWVIDLYDSNPKLAKRLAQIGLIADRRSLTLGGAIVEFLADQTHLADATQTQKKLALSYLEEHFGADKPLRDITAGDAERYRNHLVESRGLDPSSTARRSCGRCREFFAWAIRHTYIEHNPFVAVKVTVQANPEKQVFVERQWINRVMDSCPSAEWRAIVALARFGGLRLGEITRVRWCDIDWSDDDGRVTIHSPKTRHAGKPLRTIPLFPELREALAEAFEAAPEGAVRVAEGYHEDANLRTTFDKIVARAGVKPWVKPFVNMRSTRATELLDEGHSIKAVCEWLGHSEAVALKHYHQVTKKHYQAASRVSKESASREPSKEELESSFFKSSVKSSVPPAVTGEHGETVDLKTLLFPLVYDLVEPGAPQLIAQQGFEP